MDKRELAYAKQAVLIVKDWDIFQAIIRKHKHLLKWSTTSEVTGLERKKIGS